jgi:S-phase kinase-associated protein 1
MSSSNEPTVTLLSKSNDAFEVPLGVAKMSGLVKMMLPDEGEDMEEVADIPIPNVRTEVLQKVIEFCTKYRDDPMDNIEKPLKSSNMSELVGAWYANFVNLEEGEQDEDAPTTDVQEGEQDEDAPTTDVQEVEQDGEQKVEQNPKQKMLFELISAANFMDIKPLQDLTCATVASLIKGKNPEEICQTFNIANDFTPEEETQVREENKWCEEV